MDGRRDRAALEVQGDHAGLELSLADVGEAREQVEHAPVVGKHEGAEATDVPRMRGIEQAAQEDRAEAPALVPVLDDERDLLDRERTNTHGKQ